MSKENSGGGKIPATKLRYRTPEHFFPVLVDDFFKNPQALVDYGKSLPKSPDPSGSWPGKRSKNIWELNYNLNRDILLKILSCYYDLNYIDLSWENSQLKFMETPRFSENKNDVRNKGWIHKDTETLGNDIYQLAGLIYLTPDIDPDSGTILYNLKSDKAHKEFKDGHYGGDLWTNANLDIEKYTKSHTEHEEFFFEKLRVYNIFNRLIMYDTSEWHRATNYYNGDGKDARLTLGFFIGGLNEIPMKRIKNNDRDLNIAFQLKNNEN